MGSQIKNYSKNNIILSLLSNLSEKNQQVREECIKCIQNWTKNQNFEIFAENFPKLLNNDNYEMRNSILDLLLENCSLITNQYNKKFFIELLKSLLICLQDKNSEIRKKTEEFIKKFELIKKEDYYKEAKEFKPAIAEFLLNNLKQIFGDHFTFPSFSLEPNDSGLLIKKTIKKNNSYKRRNDFHSHNRSLELTSEKKGKRRISNQPNNFGFHPRDLSSEENTHRILKSNIDKNYQITEDNTELNPDNKKTMTTDMSPDINNDSNNKDDNTLNTTKNNECKDIKEVKEINDSQIPNQNKKLQEKNKDNNEFETLDKDEVHKSSENINKNKNDTNENNGKNGNNKGLTARKDKPKNKSVGKRNNIKNKKNNFIRLNLNTKSISNTYKKNDIKNSNLCNRSVVLKNDYNKTVRNSRTNNNYLIFSQNYKIKSGEKEKRYELDIKNNFLFEKQNFSSSLYLNLLIFSLFSLFSFIFH